jgi:hypothetical protein
LALTGFGQMPIFKRYYIADIPGMGWLAEFFVTHYIHYLGAIVFLAFAGYIIIDYLGLARKSRKLTATAGSNLSPGFIIFLDICHLGLVMAFLFVSLYCLIFKKQWTMIR